MVLIGLGVGTGVVADPSLQVYPQNMKGDVMSYKPWRRSTELPVAKRPFEVFDTLDARWATQS